MNQPNKETNCVAVIGAGNVGAATAYALMQSSIVREIVLVDNNAEKAEGEAMDLSHAAALGSPFAIRAGGYEDAANSDIAVITAGSGGEPGDSRLDLLEQNAPIVRDCASQLRANGFDGILLVVTNPADVLTHVAQEASGLPPEKVIGSGTLIDTARLRELLGAALNVEAGSVHAYIIGEHGDSEVAAFSCANIAGVPLQRFAEVAEASLDYDDILHRVRQAAPEVVKRKGHTAFAIASSVMRICEAILRDEHTVLAVSARLSGQYGVDGLYLGTPCIVGADGIEHIIELPLSDKERSDMHKSAQVLAKAVGSLSKSKGETSR